jgi:hypothetical protein
VRLLPPPAFGSSGMWDMVQCCCQRPCRWWLASATGRHAPKCASCGRHGAARPTCAPAAGCGEAAACGACCCCRQAWPGLAKVLRLGRAELLPAGGRAREEPRLERQRGSEAAAGAAALIATRWTGDQALAPAATPYPAAAARPAARCWLHARQRLPQRAAGGAACGRRSAPQLARWPCQSLCGTELMPQLQQTWMGASRHQAGPCRRGVPALEQPNLAQSTWAVGVGLLVRPGTKGLAHAVYRRCSDSGAAPQQSCWVPASPTMSALLPWPSYACAASARERLGRAAAGACCVAVLKGRRARPRAPPAPAVKP